jgi:hypothetical protein
LFCGLPLLLFRLLWQAYADSNVVKMQMPHRGKSEHLHTKPLGN